jgi:phospholipid/cholesterol/gamma-HCH transport system substrate-binding protein
MASRKTKFYVGLFVLVGFTLVTVLIIWLGLSNYFDSGHLYAAYFDESVQGLSKDSPVKYRGVSIGRVESIRVAPDTTLIEVILNIETGWKPEENTVAQLKAVGITGIMYIELDLKEEPDISPTFTFEPEYPVIPTKQSDIQTFLSGLQDILEQFRTFDTQEISLKIKQTLDTVNQTLKDAQMKQLSSDVQSLLLEAEKIIKAQNWERLLVAMEKTGGSIYDTAEVAEMMILEIKQTIHNIDRILSDNETKVARAISHLDSAAGEADQLMKHGIRLIDNTKSSVGSLHHRLAVTLQKLETTMQNLDNFVNRLSDHPSKLIFGSPPQERKAIR